MPKCGSQCILCDLPIRFDNYKGCTHGCRYCFTQKKIEDLNKVKTDKGVQALISFISGKRTQDTNWCDWNIPLHWGGLSDPLQPIEAKTKSTLKCLQVLEKSQYPFVISTKGKLLGEEEYISLLEKCNCVVQVSIVCDKYDKIEKGAPTFQERLEIIEKIAPRVKRVIARIQPYMCEVFDDVFKNLEKFKNAGVHGVILEGMKFLKSKQGLIKIGGDYGYPYDRIKYDFERLRAETHRLGLKFYSGENRLRGMGDSLTCCGIDGLDGFYPNTYNLSHIINDKNKVTPTKAQQEKGSALCFRGLKQDTLHGRFFSSESFETIMKWYYKENPDFINKIFGVTK